MMKYVKVKWPEIQDYMERENYSEECYFDPNKNVWFIPENWEPGYLELQEIKENVFKSIMDDYSVIEDTSEAAISLTDN